MRLDNGRALVQIRGVRIGLHMPGLAGAAPTDKSQYIWASGAPTNTYSNWGRAQKASDDNPAVPDQPDGDVQELGDVPSCVYAVAFGDYLRREVGTWNDVGCDNPKPFICEF